MAGCWRSNRGVASNGKCRRNQHLSSMNQSLWIIYFEWRIEIKQLHCTIELLFVEYPVTTRIYQWFCDFFAWVSLMFEKRRNTRRAKIWKVQDSWCDRGTLLILKNVFLKVTQYWHHPKLSISCDKPHTWCTLFSFLSSFCSREHDTRAAGTRV